MPLPPLLQAGLIFSCPCYFPTPTPLPCSRLANKIPTPEFRVMGNHVILALSSIISDYRGPAILNSEPDAPIRLGKELFSPPWIVSLSLIAPENTKYGHKTLLGTGWNTGSL